MPGSDERDSDGGDTDNAESGFSLTEDTQSDQDRTESEVRAALPYVRRAVRGMSRIAVQLQKSHELPTAP